MRTRKIWSGGFILMAMLFCLGGVNAGKVPLTTGVVPGPTPTPTPAMTLDEDESKGVTSEFFLNNRPAKKNPIPNRAKYKVPPKSGDRMTKAGPPPGTTFAQVGVTFWRLRKSTVADKTAAKELIEDEEGTHVEWTPERIDVDTPLLPGQKVRLGIESLSRAGYLYVIDRAQYADGTMGEPLLIFPTSKTNDLDPANLNRVKAGRLIYIPSATGRFTIMSGDSTRNHVGELITIIVSAQPLVPSDQLASRAIKLPRSQVESWEKQFGAPSTKFELDGGAGQAMTLKEQAAGASSAEELTQEDPLPQTVYRLAIRPDDPILLSVVLRFHR